MTRKWQDIRKQLSPEREARIAKRVNEEMNRLSLTQLRKARNLTQENLAKALRVNQGAISKLEQRTDAYLSTLRSYLNAMGADLQIRAVFPDGEVLISQFEDIAPTLSIRMPRRAARRPARKIRNEKKIPA